MIIEFLDLIIFFNILLNEIVERIIRNMYLFIVLILILIFYYVCGLCISYLFFSKGVC